MINLIELFKLWEYEKTISHGQNLLGAYIKRLENYHDDCPPTSEFRPKIRLVQDPFKSCFDTAKRKISKNAADPAKKYGDLSYLYCPFHH